MNDCQKPGHIDVALIHYPVVNKKGDIIGSAVTNLDLHDIARVSRTFGVKNYFVVTPYEEQQQLASEIIAHWTTGSGRKANPDRCEALSLVRVCKDLDAAVEYIEDKYNKKPIVVATCAKEQIEILSVDQVQKLISTGQSILLLFGTAWGLAPELIDIVDGTLPPINGSGDYNHLSVRSAVSIILDRLID